MGDKFILLGKKSNEVLAKPHNENYKNEITETKESSSKTIEEYPYSISENDKYFTYCNDSLKKCYEVIISQSDVEISEYGCDTAFFIGDFDEKGKIIDERKGFGINNDIKIYFKMINNILFVSYDYKRFFRFISKFNKEKKDGKEN